MIDNDERKPWIAELVCGQRVLTRHRLGARSLYIGHVEAIDDTGVQVAFYVSNNSTNVWFDHNGHARPTCQRETEDGTLFRLHECPRDLDQTRPEFHKRILSSSALDQLPIEDLALLAATLTRFQNKPLEDL